MNYYKGIVWGKDEPQNGGSYVKETLDAHEKYNFEAIPLTEESGYPKGEYCLGFVETKSTNKETRNQLRIEKIYDCEGMNEETSVDDVLVVYCALYPDAIEKETYVVGDGCRDKDFCRIFCRSGTGAPDQKGTWHLRKLGRKAGNPCGSGTERLPVRAADDRTADIGADTQGAGRTGSKAGRTGQSTYQNNGRSFISIQIQPR